jgi:hypothetical protein
LTKPENRKTLTVDEGIKLQLFTRGFDVFFEFHSSRFPPGTTFGKGYPTREGTECVLMVEGELKVETGGEVHYSKPGDTLTMKSSTPIGYPTRENEEALAIWVDSVPWVFSTM